MFAARQSLYNLRKTQLKSCKTNHTAHRLKEFYTLLQFSIYNILYVKQLLSETPGSQGDGYGKYHLFHALSDKIHDEPFQVLQPFCEKRLLTSSCLSVCPHGITRLPLDRYLGNLINEEFSKSGRVNSSLIRIWQENRATLHLKLWKFILK